LAYLCNIKAGIISLPANKQAYMPAYHNDGMSQTATQQYKKKCTKCQNEILMSNASGKWKAMETDGSVAHQCNSGGNGSTSTTSIGKSEPRPSAFQQQQQIK
jgi:hypothetical protein